MYLAFFFLFCTQGDTPVRTKIPQALAEKCFWALCQHLQIHEGGQRYQEYRMSQTGQIYLANDFRCSTQFHILRSAYFMIRHEWSFEDLMKEWNEEERHWIDLDSAESVTVASIIRDLERNQALIEDIAKVMPMTISALWLALQPLAEELAGMGSDKLFEEVLQIKD